MLDQVYSRNLKCIQKFSLHFLQCMFFVFWSGLGGQQPPRTTSPLWDFSMRPGEGYPKTMGTTSSEDSHLGQAGASCLASLLLELLVAATDWLSVDDILK